MRTGSRVALLAVLCTAGLALPATPVRAGECVKVAVDYGTAPGAPAGPDTRCVTVPDDAVAAHALGNRARYKGNFLCAIDGYPESGCGDEPPSPYWSFWVWKSGTWVYASEGVATYRVGDTDGDGHPDPLGFRFHEVDGKAPPRANPSYPTSKPARTTAPAPPPTRTAAPRTTAPGGVASSNLASTTTAPAATGSAAPLPVAGRSAGATPDPTAGPTTPGTTEPSASAAAGDVPRDAGGGGFPVGTVAGATLAAGLLAAAALRFRRTP